MTKLIVSYDISEEDEDKRSNVEAFLEDTTKHEKWVRLQDSIWVILSKTSAKSKFDALDGYLPNSLVAVVDITNKKVENNGFLEASKPNGEIILGVNF